MLHTADPRRRVGEDSRDGCGLGRIADRPHVDVDAVQPPALRLRDGDRSGLPLDTGSHPLQHIGKADVALQRVAVQPLHRGPTGQRTGRQPVRRGRGVRLDLVRRPFGDVRLRANQERVRLRLGHIRLERPHHRQRHVDVRPRDQLPLDPQRDIAARAGGRHQQAAEELTRQIAADGDLAAGEPTPPHRHRRAARLSRGDIGPALPQRRGEIGDRPLLHAGVAGEHIVAAGCRTGRGEKADAGAGVPQVQPHGARLTSIIRKPATLPFDAQRLGPRVQLNRQPQPVERVPHHAGVLTVEHAREHRDPIGQRRHDRRPIGQRLRPRRPHRNVDRPRRRGERANGRIRTGRGGRRSRHTRRV